MKKVVAIILLACMGITAVGCVALSEYATPTPVSQAAVKYAAEAGVIDANSFRGYANLHKARKLGAAVKAAYEVNTLAMDQLQERHELDYAILSEVVSRDTKIGEHREQALFSETGLLPAVLGLAGMGGLGGLIGLSRKRPGDVTPEELKAATAQAGIDLKDKERQMLEIVQGVQKFLDAPIPPGNDYKAELKGALTMAQSGDTRKAVAVLKTV